MGAATLSTRRALTLHFSYLLCARIALSQGNMETISLSPATTLAGLSNYSQIINPAFAGMGIEPSNLFSFTGETKANQLTVNLLTTLSNYTGVPPQLRIGGNTEDNFIYDPNFQDYYVKTNEQTTGMGNEPWDKYTIGPKYFEAIDRFPEGTPITFGLSLAYDADDWADKIVEKADAARTMLKRTSLVSFEIGNEPDLYHQNNFRADAAWAGTSYVEQWRERCDAVYQRVLKPNNITSAFFEPSCTASTIGTTFEIVQLEADGINAPANNTPNGVNTSYIATWNQHDYYYYISVSTYDLELGMLMDLSTTPTQFYAWTTQIQQAASTGYPYTLREMASVGPIGLPGISDTFGATLWTLNFMLYTASLNVSSVEFHMTDNSWASPWQPITIYNTPPHVRTTYYAFAAMAQLIGAACNTRVAPIPIAASDLPNGYSAGRLTAYGIYTADDAKLASLVLLNTAQANVSSTDKGSVTWNINLPGLAGQTLFLSYLTAAGADATQNTTWNGLSFEADASGLPTSLNTPPKTITISSSGTASIPVRDSEAVVANLGHQLGTGVNSVYDQAACRKLAQSGVIPDELPAKLLTTSVSSHMLPTPGPNGDGSGENGVSTKTKKGGAGAAVTPPPRLLGALAAGVVGGLAVGFA